MIYILYSISLSCILIDLYDFSVCPYPQKAPVYRPRGRLALGGWMYLVGQFFWTIQVPPDPIQWTFNCPKKYIWLVVDKNPSDKYEFVKWEG